MTIPRYSSTKNTSLVVVYDTMLGFYISLAQEKLLRIMPYFKFIEVIRRLRSNTYKISVWSLKLPNDKYYINLNGIN